MEWITETVHTVLGDINVLTWAAASGAVDEKDKVTDSKLLVALEPAEDQLGAVLWNSNATVTAYLDGHLKQCCPGFSWKGAHVLELGAGLGCLGIALAAAGASVAVTDIKELVPLMSHNVGLNRAAIRKAGGACIAYSWRWGDAPPKEFVVPTVRSDQGGVFWVVLCDALFGNPKDWPKLIQTLNSICDAASPQWAVQVINFCEQRVDQVEDAFVSLLRLDPRWLTDGPNDVCESSSLGMKVRVSVFRRSHKAPAVLSDQNTVAGNQRRRDGVRHKRRRGDEEA